MCGDMYNATAEHSFFQLEKKGTATFSFTVVTSYDLCSVATRQ